MEIMWHSSSLKREVKIFMISQGWRKCFKNWGKRYISSVMKIRDKKCTNVHSTWLIHNIYSPLYLINLRNQVIHNISWESIPKKYSIWKTYLNDSKLQWILMILTGYSIFNVSIIHWTIFYLVQVTLQRR